METTYTIIGADGQQYGPISLEQLKGWVAERRVNPETKILRSDINSWLPAAQYTELGMAQQVQPVAASDEEGACQCAVVLLDRRVVGDQHADCDVEGGTCFRSGIGNDADH